jgi:hypothetical protein
VRQNGLEYPVAQDNDFATWTAYGNQFWPAKYLIDARGRVRYTHFGEGEYDGTERAIRALLEEAGRDELGGRAAARSESAVAGATPETYLGAERAERFVTGPLSEGRQRFSLPDEQAARLPVHHLGFDGRWLIRRQSAEPAAGGARLQLRFAARKVFLVLGSRGASRAVEVALDGRAYRTVRVGAHRLYELVRLRRPGVHLLTLRIPRGVEGYAFTFG